MSSTWEAFRLTSKSPSELLAVLGPHGVDHLIRQALDALWRAHPIETRTLANVEKDVREVFERNMRVWTSIKKPTPDAFFQELGSGPADGYMRQAMVLSWMMLPRTGGRDFKETRGIIRRIFERNLEGWREDNQTFTGKKSVKRAPKKKVKPAKAAKVKSKPKK